MLHRHATDVVSLVAGTIFAGMTAVWLLTLGDVIDLEAAWLAGPVVLIIAGIVGLVAAFRPSRPSPSTQWPDSAAAQPVHTDRPEGASAHDEAAGSAPFVGTTEQTAVVDDDSEPTEDIDGSDPMVVVNDDSEPTEDIDGSDPMVVVNDDSEPTEVIDGSDPTPVVEQDAAKESTDFSPGNAPSAGDEHSRDRTD